MSERMVKGWCPTTRKPMPSGDGLLMRLKPHMHRLTAEEFTKLCDAACQYGSSILALTSRANLQIRGLTEQGYEALISDLSDAGIIPDETPLYEDLNLLVSPFWRSGDIHNELADQLLRRCAELPQLPAKFGFALDLGEQPVLRDASADIRLERAAGGDFLLYADSTDSGIIVTQDNAIDEIIRLAHFYATHKRGMQRRISRFIRDGGLTAEWQQTPIFLPQTPYAPEPGNISLADTDTGHQEYGQLAGLPLGRADASQLKEIIQLSGAEAVRLTPYNLLLLEAVQDFTHPAIITDAQNPLLKIKACVGAPYCQSAFINTDEIAHAVQGLDAEFIHISGCGKGCAYPYRAALTITGQPDTLHVVENGYPWDEPVLPPVAHDEPEAVGALFAQTEDSTENEDTEELSEDSYIIAGTKNEAGEYLYDTDGSSIYVQSFAIIRAEADLARFTPEEEQVAVRMIHAAGLVELAPYIHFSPDFVDSARTALENGAPLFCDARMVSEGITPSRLPAHNEIICTLHDERTRPLAQKMGNTRSAAALELWRPRLEGAVVAIGNAPTALFHLLNMLKQPDCPRPAAIIGCPVGFVGAAESKQALLEDYPTPFCITHGRLGGSAITVAAINAIASRTEILR